MSIDQGTAILILDAIHTLSAMYAENKAAGREPTAAEIDETIDRVLLKVKQHRAAMEAKVGNGATDWNPGDAGGVLAPPEI